MMTFPKFGEPIPYDMLPEIERQIRDAMAAAGVFSQGELEIVLDGETHRFDVDGGKRGGKDGAYRFWPDWFPNGWFQDHRQHPEPIKWRFDPSSLGDEYKKFEMTPEMVEARKRQEAERKRQREEEEWQRDKKISQMMGIYDNAPKVKETHPYLIKKKVEVWGDIREDGAGNALISMKDINGTFQGLQRILREPPEVGTNKPYDAGSRMKGAWFVLEPV